MTLSEKLQNLLAAQQALCNVSMLPETIRGSLYSLATDIGKINANIVKLTEEIMNDEVTKSQPPENYAQAHRNDNNISF